MEHIWGRLPEKAASVSLRASHLVLGKSVYCGDGKGYRHVQFKGFTLDPFQEKAIQTIESEQSVLVAAPTGAGKTLIAEYAVELALGSGQGVIYTAPIKALSNQKYRDFTQRYPGQVGIMTGDVTIDPDAPLQVMTTEIFRNTIFEDISRLDQTTFVIFDEIHFLDNVERGTVWEESIIFAPVHMRFICLSATVPNVKELATWMEQIRNHPVGVVKETKRPVPLEHRFFVDGRLRRKLKGPPQKRKRGRNRPLRKPKGPSKLVKIVSEQKLLPCLYFAFGRARCRELATAHSNLHLLKKEERRAILQLFDDLAERYGVNEENSCRRLRRLVGRGVAFHHAGMLPTLKEMVERLFTSGLLKLIFTTETFALGINMPAQAVIFDELRKFDGFSVVDLLNREYHQMAGRAGRRGLDEKGFVYSQIDTRRISFPRVKRIIYGEPEPVRSQFNTSYSTLLNIYRDLGETVPAAYEKSLHWYQSGKKERSQARKMIVQKLDLLKDLGYIAEGELSEKGKLAAKIYGYELTCTELLVRGLLDELDETFVAVLAMAIVYEPRRDTKQDEPKEGSLASLQANAHEVVRQIRLAEKKRKIRPRTPKIHFGLSETVSAWVNGCDFSELLALNKIDEGELVRHLRRATQFLKQLRKARGQKDHLDAKLWRASETMRRDLVDAERQLRTP